MTCAGGPSCAAQRLQRPKVLQKAPAPLVAPTANWPRAMHYQATLLSVWCEARCVSSFTPPAPPLQHARVAPVTAARSGRARVPARCATLLGRHGGQRTAGRRARAGLHAERGPGVDAAHAAEHPELGPLAHPHPQARHAVRPCPTLQLMPLAHPHPMMRHGCRQEALGLLMGLGRVAGGRAGA